MDPNNLTQTNHTTKPFNKYIILVLFVFSFTVYIPALNNGFTLDDALVLTENSYTQTADIKNILTKDTFSGYFNKKSSINLVEGGRYRPLSLIIFSGIWQITQTPFTFHLINLVFYALSVVLIFILINQLIGVQQSPPRSKTLVAALTALLFSLHPVHTEVVNNIKSLDEILSLFFALLAWIMLLKPSSNPHSLLLKLSTLVIFLLAMLAKETAVVMLPIIFIGFVLFQNSKPLQALKQTTPVLLGFVIYLVIRTLVLGDFQAAQVNLEPLNNPFLKYIDNLWMPLSISEKTGTILFALKHYLMLLIMPINLTHDYYPQVIPITPLINISAIVSLIIHVVMVVCCVWGLKKRTIYGFALFIYLVSIGLFSNVLINIGTVMAERFLYVPSLGFSLLVAGLLVKYFHLIQTNTHLTRKMATWVLATVVLTAVSLSTIKIINRSKDWHSNFTLFKADIKVSADSAKLQNALGGELTVQSQKPLIKGSPREQLMLDQAIQHLNQAIQIHPTYALAYMLKGNALHYSGQHQAAIEQFKHALDFKPDFADAKNNLQLVQQHIKQQNQLQAEQKAMQAGSQGNHLEAIEIFTRLIKDTHSSKHYFFRGVAYANNNQLNLALKDFIAAEKADPLDNPENAIRIYQAIKNTYTQLGQINQANTYQSKIEDLQ